MAYESGFLLHATSCSRTVLSADIAHGSHKRSSSRAPAILQPRGMLSCVPLLRSTQGVSYAQKLLYRGARGSQPIKTFTGEQFTSQIRWEQSVCPAAVCVGKASGVRAFKVAAQR